MLHGLCAVHPANCRLAGYKCVSAYACALVCLCVCVWRGGAAWLHSYSCDMCHNYSMNGHLL